MARSLCHLLIKVNHDWSRILNVANISFKAIRENKILLIISESTVYTVHYWVCYETLKQPTNESFRSVAIRSEAA